MSSMERVSVNDVWENGPIIKDYGNEKQQLILGVLENENPLLASEHPSSLLEVKDIINGLMTSQIMLSERPTNRKHI